MPASFRFVNQITLIERAKLWFLLLSFGDEDLRDVIQILVNMIRKKRLLWKAPLNFNSYTSNMQTWISHLSLKLVRIWWQFPCLWICWLPKIFLVSTYEYLTYESYFKWKVLYSNLLEYSSILYILRKKL